MRYLKPMCAGVMGALLFAPAALAAFGPVPRQQVGNLVGARSAGSCSDDSISSQTACSTAGETWSVSSDTGIYEIVVNQQTLIFAIVGMVMATAGFMLFRTWLRRGRG